MAQSITGTASNGVDYANLIGTVVIPAAAHSVFAHMIELVRTGRATVRVAFAPPVESEGLTRQEVAREAHGLDAALLAELGGDACDGPLQAELDSFLAAVRARRGPVPAHGSARRSCRA